MMFLFLWNLVVVMIANASMELVCGKNRDAVQLRHFIVVLRIFVLRILHVVFWFLLSVNLSSRSKSVTSPISKFNFILRRRLL